MESSAWLRRWKPALALLLLLNLGAGIALWRTFWQAHHVRVVAPAPSRGSRPHEPRALATNPPVVATRSAAKPAELPVVMAATSPVVPAEQERDAAGNTLIDGDEFVAELTKTAGLSELESTSIRRFLGIVARSQERVETLTSGDRQADLERRLTQQAVAGIRIRVAAEKRAALEPLLDKGVPPLRFRDAAPAP